MVDHDRLFKELISTFFLEFIELFLPRVRAYIDGGFLEFLDKEIFSGVTSGERHEVDLVAKVRFKGDETFFLVHVENQAQPSANFAKRMHSYFARLHDKYGLPVYPIGLFTYPAPTKKQGCVYRVRFPDRDVLTFRFEGIQLNQLDWRRFARRRNPVAVALMSRMNIAPKDRPRVRLACVRLLATLKLDRAKTQVILGILDTYLRLNEQEQTKYQAALERIAPAEKEKVMEVTLVWKEEGRLEGLEQGLEQGRRKLSSVIAKTIDRQLGPLEPAVLDQIRQLSYADLESLGDAMSDFTSSQDLARWLQAR